MVSDIWFSSEFGDVKTYGQVMVNWLLDGWWLVIFRSRGLVVSICEFQASSTVSATYRVNISWYIRFQLVS